MNKIKKLLVFLGIILLSSGIFIICFNLYVFGSEYFYLNIGMILGFGLSIGGVILLIGGVRLKG
ncbi:MAG: hypothetical protein ACFFA3_13620 [Promethearchaeota archaeon]